MPAIAQPIACPKCKAVLGAEFFNQPVWLPCPSCASGLRVAVFPALFREEKTVAAERIMTEGEASCFYHPEKKAAVVCESCGRFVCALCDMDFNGQHLCPACLESGGKKGKIAKLQNTRTRHDRIAIALAVLPMLIFYFTIVSAPAALFYSIWHWKSPGSIVPNWRRLNLVIAIIIASLEITGWVVFFTWLAIKK
ncbi:MAG TPA: hypothetical protein VG347_23895 [Verrucomicrobiae bacterium]|nr:hypothetical protein [Verrucomicrobiae bacterium]